MKAEHSFFIPDIGNCIDVVGFLKKLATKIAKDMDCIFCEHKKNKTFKSFRDLQKHMKDMGHCMINPDFISDYKQFYDYTDDNMAFLEKYFVCVGENKEAEVAIYEPKDNLKNIDLKIEGEEDDDDWEDLDEEDAEWESEEPNLDKVNASSENRKEEAPTYWFKKVKIGEMILDLSSEFHFRNFMINNSKKTEIGEIVLPNQKTIGNRKYAAYYKQNIPSHWLYSSKQLLEILSDKGAIPKGDEDAVALYSHQDLRKLYVKTVYNERNMNVVVRTREDIKNENNLKRKMMINTQRNDKRDKRHNKILTKYFMDQNLAFNY